MNFIFTNYTLSFQLFYFFNGNDEKYFHEQKFSQLKYVLYIYIYIHGIYKGFVSSNIKMVKYYILGQLRMHFNNLDIKLC